MEELFKVKMSLLQEYLAVSKEHADILSSDDFERLEHVLKSKSELINKISAVDDQLLGYRRQDTLPLIGGICDMEQENIRMTEQRMHELKQLMRDIDKRKTLIDRYTDK